MCCLHQLCLRGSAAGLQGSAADLHGLAKGSSRFYTALQDPSGFCTTLQSSTVVLSLPSSTAGFFVAVLRTACSVGASCSEANLLTSFVADLWNSGSARDDLSAVCLNYGFAGDDLGVARLNSVPAQDDLGVARLKFVFVLVPTQYSIKLNS
ncbi:hypothetical protein AMECASPLE_019636, partial [Ameca splendens]